MAELTTTLFEFRHALRDLIIDAVAAVDGDVPVLWDAPTTVEDIEVGRAVWFIDPVDAAMGPYTMPSGITEAYEQELAIRFIPGNADVTSQDAAGEVHPLLTAVVNAVRDNPRMVDAPGWSTVVRLAGWTFLSGQVKDPQGSPIGYAAGFNVRIAVEASAC